MKLFTKSILAAVALSVMAVPMAQAQQRHEGARQGQHFSQPKKPVYQAPSKHQAQKPAPQRHHAQRPAPTRQHWSKGKRVPDWQRRQQVRDYHRHGLRKPARGQQWIKVDNDFLLITLATGLIAGIAASR